MTPWVVDWLRAFAVTVVVEAVVAVPLMFRVEPRWGRRLAAVVLVNLATHPLVWFLFPGLHLRTAARIGVSEIWAVGMESGAYLVIWPALGARRAGGLAVVANGASLALGLVLRAAHLL